MSNYIITGILEILENQRSFLDKVTNLSDEDINWSPSENKHSKRNTIGILLEHIPGAEKFLVHESIFGEKIKRDRDGEFSHDKSRSKNDLIQSFKETADKTTNLLNSINDDKLKKEVKVRTHTKTVLWILLHLIEHNYYHIGQINYIIGMMNKN